MISRNAGNSSPIAFALMIAALALSSCSPGIMRAAYQGETQKVRDFIAQGEDIKHTRSWIYAAACCTSV